jgi:dynein heavy chain 2
VWEERLVLLDAVLHLLNPIQRKWVYLEPIFGRGALPHEQARFRRIDEDFKAIMNGIEVRKRHFCDAICI